MKKTIMSAASFGMALAVALCLFITYAHADVAGISISPSTGSATYTQGATLTSSDTTLSSDHDDSGLTTTIALVNSSSTPVNFDTIFASFELTTGSDGPYDLVALEPSQATLLYGPVGGYSISSTTPQVTTLTGAINASAPAGTYTITTQVLKGGVVQTTATYALTITPRVVDVTEGTGYASIQDAVTAAASGDTIDVASGTYNETVNVTKPLTIRGAQAGVAGSAHSGSESSVAAFNVSSNNVVIDGFALTNGGPQATVSSTTAIMSGVVLENNVFNGYTDVAVPTYGAGDILIENNRFVNVSGNGEAMQIKADASNAGGCSGTQVLNNVFDHATNNGGADINFSCTDSDSENVTISGNTSTGISGGSSLIAFSGVDTGIVVSNNAATTDGSTIFFFGNMTGTALIENNTIKNSGGSAISIHGAGDVGTSDSADNGAFTITGNTLTGNGNGVSVSAAALGTGGSVTLRNNIISGNISANVNNATTTAIDAANNWWGNASSTVFASSLHGSVNYTPWYINPSMTVLSNAVSDTGEANSTTGNFDVVSDNPGQAVIPSGVTKLTLADNTVLDLSSATTSDSASVQIGGNTVSLTQSVVLQSGVDTEPVVLANSNLADIIASIPDGTKISGPAEWDGTIAPPVSVSASGDAPAGFTVGSTVISVGSSSGTLVFDQPVTLVLANVTGAVGYKPANSNSWTRITSTCAGTYDLPTAPTAPGECAISNGTDTKILTYHFTTFGGLNAIPSSPSVGGGSASEGGHRQDVSSLTGGANGAGQVLGAFTTADNQAQIALIKSQLISLISQLITRLQAQLAAAIAAGQH